LQLVAAVVHATLVAALRASVDRGMQRLEANPRVLLAAALSDHVDACCCCCPDGRAHTVGDPHRYLVVLSSSLAAS
jgi:hypothetical protein